MHNFKSFRLLRIRAVMSMRGNKSHTSVYNDVREGLLPPPIPISHRATAWPEYEVVAINCYRIAGKSSAQIKALVQELIGERAALADQRDLVYVVRDGDVPGAAEQCDPLDSQVSA